MAFLDELNRFLAALRSKESGGNYRAVGAATKYGKATGERSRWRAANGTRRLHLFGKIKGAASFSGPRL